MSPTLFKSLFPKTCPACHQGAETLLCSECQEQVTSWVGRGCLRCAEDHGPYLRPETCPSCRHDHWFLERVVAASSYSSPVRDALLQLKFGGRGTGAGTFADWLAPLALDEDIDLLVPVPNPFWRQMTRGYNQAELIARCLSRQTNLPYRRCLSSRFRRSQLRRKARERRYRSPRDFKVRLDVDNLHVGLVDDVFTTGGTANACARALLDAGAQKVTALVVARQPKER